MSNVAPTSSGSQYSDHERLEACAHYLVTGNLQATSKALNIPRRTLLDWSRSEWWEYHSNEIRQQTKAKTLSQLDRLIERAHDAAIERIEQGDPIIHQGEVTGYAPVRARDAAVVGAVAIDKRQILLNQPTSIRGESAGMTDLVKRFEELAAQSQERIVSDQ